MCLAILCYNITHPGTVLRGPEAALPTIRSLVFKKRRARKSKSGSGVEGGVEMGNKYVELGEEQVSLHVELEGKDPREGRRSFREKFGLWWRGTRRLGKGFWPPFTNGELRRRVELYRCIELEP
jgi:hypothetical protein